MKVFTVKQAAKICKVEPRSVIKWIERGRLKGAYKIPHSKDDYRIDRECLIAFMKENGIPLGDLDDGSMMRVLIVSSDPMLIEKLDREFTPQRSFSVKHANDGFTTGIEAESFHPECCVVDFSIGVIEATMICDNFRAKRIPGEVVLIAVAPEEIGLGSCDLKGISKICNKPFEGYLLAEEVRSLILGRRQLM